MANQKQRKARRQRAAQATRPAARSVSAALPEAFFSDEQWLAWGCDRGLDLSNRDQLLDSASVGLTVLCWRNTVLEDVHAGGEREDRIGDEASEREARRAHRLKLDRDIKIIRQADPDEHARMRVLLDGRAQGFGIPDDVMMRLNVSTARDVREVLAETLPSAVTEVGTELAYRCSEAPDHVTTLVGLLQDPNRELTVGGSRVTARAILGASWDEYRDDVIRKITTHLTFCDTIGARRALWHVALSGTIYATEWFPSPWWRAAVRMLRHGSTGADDIGIDRMPQATDDRCPFGDDFWDGLMNEPETLNAQECLWVQGSRLGNVIREIQEAERQRLGPLDDNDRFPGLAIIF